METMEVLTDIAERVAEYRMFYPDTTLTTISSNAEETFNDKEALELSQKVCSMTNSGLLQYKAAGKSLWQYGCAQRGGKLAAGERCARKGKTLQSILEKEWWHYG